MELMKAHGDRVLIFDVREGWAPLSHTEVDDANPLQRIRGQRQSLKTVRKVMDFMALFLPLGPRS